VVNQFGATSKEAHEFGYLPARVPVRSVETKLQAVLQSKATREARHTMGSRQRKEIKGVLPAPGEPAPPANNVSPAPSTGSTGNGVQASMDGVAASDA
jgi:hypothetical protein